VVTRCQGIGDFQCDKLKNIVTRVAYRLRRTKRCSAKRRERSRNGELVPKR